LYNTYLPLVQYDEKPNVIGVQLEGDIAANLPFLVPKSAAMVHLRWYECETAIRQYSFPQAFIDGYEQLGEDRYTLVQLKNAPEWMRIYPDVICSAIYPGFYKEASNFVRQVIERFHPHAVELWNEPNVDPNLLADGHDYYYGGWGRIGDQYNAGLAYGEFLDCIYSDLKPDYPEVRFLAGALSMGGDVDEFIDGFTARGEYDGITFHSYPYYGGEPYNVIERDAQRIQRFDSHTPWGVTETSLLWWGDGAVTDEFLLAQAEYFTDALEMAKSSALTWFLWYCANNTWKHCGLAENGKKKPVWYTYSERLE
jgi:hypothetical protein